MVLLWCLIFFLCQADPANADCNANATCTECKYGTFLSSNDGYCRQCYYTCKTCLNGSICAACGSSECDLCSHSCASDECRNTINCTECIDGFYPYRNFCFRCKNTGCKCNDIYDCFECLPRRYGVNCESTCPNECSKCNDSLCTGCISGKYGTHCQTNCSAGCKDGLCSTNDGVCTQGCKTGEFGLTCEDKCPQSCAGNVCNRTNGQCTNGCKNGYFFNGDTCQKCPENCLNCNSTSHCFECERGFYFDFDSAKCSKCGGRCLSCSDYQHCLVCNRTYYWGSACQYDCTGCYSSCNQTNGCSIQCHKHYYSLYNDYNGGFECIRCPNTDPSIKCDSCTNGSFCNECKPGFWGAICEKNCTGCVCDKGKGCICDDGYAPITNENESFCIPCPAQCQRCSNSSSCDECKEGFYLTDDSMCLSCSGNCKDTSLCNGPSGACSSGCVDGWWGEKCDKQCSSTCVVCEQSDPYNCTKCYQGYFGNNCENNCNSNCAVVEEESTCSKDSGSCLRGCQHSFWGSTCMHDCSVGCNGSFCTQTTGACINGCKSNFFGKQCNNACSANCRDLQKNWTVRVCDVQTGHCLYGCIVGLYGEFCSEVCSKGCYKSTCNHDNGKCSFGCSDGYGSDECVKEAVSGDVNTKDDNISATVIGLAAGAVVIATVVVVSVVLVFQRRRRRRSGKEVASEDCANLEANDTELKEGPIYSKINKKRAKDSKDTINIMQTAPISDRAANQKGDAFIDDLCLDTPELAEDIRFRDHSLAEYDVQVNKEEELLEETEFVGQSDPRTYYNTIGRRVHLDKLADYVEHKAVQDIEDEFHKLPTGLSTEKEYSVARRRMNISRNKYKFIYPYDESRVVLKDGRNDYINASYIEGFNRVREYIAAMGPFEKGNVDTVQDFWRMIWQEQCETVVMLTNLVENKQTKCKQYWPEPGTSETYDYLHVTCTTEDVYADFVIRTFTVTKGEDMLRVRHLHFTAWPDKSVPDDVTCLIEFRQKVRSLQKEKTCPMIVHCSAGIGRTGTYIALDILTFEGEARGYLDIFGCVATIRSQRVNLVQTPEQYVYLHHALVHSLTFNCQSIQGDMFIEHYRKLTEMTNGNIALAKQYEKLQSSFPVQSSEEISLIQDKTLANKIRKGADVPGDNYRVVLRESRKPGAPDFINAIFINGFRTRNKFIAAQTPLPSTVVDFLSMVIQEKCSCIVMMDEPSLKDKTVGIYWPADNQVIKHGVFQVSCLESASSPNYTVKRLVITYYGQDKKTTYDVHLFMFNGWPKESVIPKTPESLLELIKAVDFRARGSTNKGPIVIHCMTGSQRSCLYCAVSVLIEKMEIEHEVSVVNTLRQIKTRRRSAVPTLEQYKFCHQAAVSYLQSFDIYSNFGLRSSQAATL